MSSRYIRHSHEPSTDLQALKEKMLRLRRDVETIWRDAKGRWSEPHGTSVYTGVPGFLVMDMVLSSMSSLRPALEKGQTNIPQIDRFDSSLLLYDLNSASFRPDNPAKASFLETPIGSAVLIITLTLDAGKAPDNTTTFCTHILQLCTDAITKIANNVDDGSEVLYGRAGLLYGLLRVRSSLTHWNQHEADIAGLNEEQKAHLEKLRATVSDDKVAAVCRSIIHRGRVGASTYSSEVLRERNKLPALMWSWHSKRYLGAAHGVAGILHILLLCPPQIVHNYVPEIHQTAEWLLGCQDSHGNWPTKAPMSHVPNQPNYQTNELVQWCHGAPGMLMFFSKLLYLSSQIPEVYSIPPGLVAKIVPSLRNGASIVYRHGLLRKGVGLCHGVAGSVYALLAVSDALAVLHDNAHQKNSEYYFLRAAHLAELATQFDRLTAEGGMSVPDRPWSLYEGLAGMCCAWGEVYDRIESAATSPNGWNRSRSGMPGFDDI